jgi:hypothetical protein
MDNQTQTPAPLAPVSQYILPSATDLFKHALSIYRTHLKMFIGIAIIPTIVTVAGIVLQYAHISGFGGLLILISIILGILSYIAQLQTLHANGSSEGGIAGAYRRATTLFFPFLWISILTGLAAWGGILLFIVPGIYIGLALFFSSYILVVENKRGLDALVQSWHYVKGHWWDLFVKMLYFGFIMLLVFIAMAIVGAIISAVTGSTFSIPKSAITHGEQNVVVSILQQIVSALFITPLTIIYSYLLYQAARIMKPEPVTVEEAHSSRTKIIIFSVLGIVAIAAFVLTLGFIFVYLFRSIPGSMHGQPLQQSAAVITHFLNLFQK